MLSLGMPSQFHADVLLDARPRRLALVRIRRERGELGRVLLIIVLYLRGGDIARGYASLFRKRRLQK